MNESSEIPYWNSKGVTYPLSKKKQKQKYKQKKKSQQMQKLVIKHTFLQHTNNNIDSKRENSRIHCIKQFSL